MALGRLYLASGRHEQAEAVYSRLAASRPLDADVHVGLAEALEDQGRREDAERSYRKAIEVEPGYWRAHNALGTFLFRSGRAGRVGGRVPEGRRAGSGQCIGTEQPRRAPC